MTDAQFSQLCKGQLKGDILVTKDSTTFFINHGHSALVYKPGKLTVEHTGEGKSDIYDMSRWKNNQTARVYYPEEASEFDMEMAAEYAKEHLVGLDYAPLASCRVKEVVNCATLVWRAYNQIHIELNKYGSETCVPKCFVVGDSKTILRTSVNWSGGSHDW